jgi:hypothetical protein
MMMKSCPDPKAQDDARTYADDVIAVIAKEVIAPGW